MRLTATILLIAQLLARSLAVQHGHAPDECRSHGVDHDARTHVHFGLWGGHTDNAEHTGNTDRTELTDRTAHSHDMDRTELTDTTVHTHDTDGTELTDRTVHSHDTDRTELTDYADVRTFTRSSHVPFEQDSYVFSFGSAVLAAPEPRVVAPTLDEMTCWLVVPDTTIDGTASSASVSRRESRQADISADEGRFLFLAHVLRI